MPVRPLIQLVLASALSAQAPPHAEDPAREFFASGKVVRLQIDLAETGRQQLLDKPREYVECRVVVDGKETWRKVGVKLKGSAGSFRELDDKPGLTLKLDKFGEQQTFHGLHKFHLNNGVQDDTYLAEWLGHEVFTTAGLPAPRVAHARVVVDGRDLGFYVLRESFDKQFLQRCFGSRGGNLYDGGFCRDIDSDLEKDAGDGPDDHSDLRRLCDACRGDKAKLGEVVDIDAFIDFAVVEAMLGHWDGYCQNRNNFRLWIAPDGKARFLPHGMDQLLGDVDASVLRHPTAILADAVMQVPEYRQRYRERLKALLPLLQPQKLQPKLAAIASKLRPVLHSYEPQAASAFAGAVRGLQDRIAQRYKSLLAQSKAPEPLPLQFVGDKPIAVKDWRPAAESDHIALGRKQVSGKSALQLACTGRGTDLKKGAFRTSALLGQGRYRLQVMVRTDGIEAAGGADPDEVGGASLRCGDDRSEALLGDHGWQELACEFGVGEFQREVELELRLRAVAGKAAFRLDSLQLVRLGD